MWWAELLNSIVSILDAGGAAGGGASFESIATATANGSSSTITFSSIPATYTSLQIRINSKSNRTATTATALYATVNSDTGANYAYHFLYGDGSAAGSTGSTSSTSMMIGYEAGSNAGSNANTFGTTIIDVHDYASTSRNKTFRSFAGTDNNGTGQVRLMSGLWMSTSAITSIALTDAVDNFTSGSTFSLYGIKG
jgi:hypothetical protein